MDLFAALKNCPSGITPEKLSPHIVEEVDRRYDFICQQEGGLHSGTVWQALDRARQTTVAIRLFRPRNHVCTPRLAVCLQQKLYPTIHLNHPNIVRTHDVRELGDHSYLIAMDFVAGPKLSKFIDRKQPLPFDRTLDILIQLASALEFAHGLEILRQHLAPGQIMLPTSDCPVLVDWGLTLRLDVCVSPHGLAPEPPSVHDCRTDIYLLGVIAYAMATGESPFAGTKLVDVVAEQHQDRIISAHSRNRSVPHRFDRFLRRSVRLNPNDRYSSMAEALTELHRLREEDRDKPQGRRSRVLPHWRPSLLANTNPSQA